MADRFIDGKSGILDLVDGEVETSGEGGRCRACKRDIRGMRRESQDDGLAH